MQTASRDRARPVSLNQRIRETEHQLADRQRSVGLRAAALRRSFRAGLGSPITLLVAGGVGFAVGQFSKRKLRAPHAGTALPGARPSFVATLLEAFTLATTVMAMLPARRRGPPCDVAPADGPT